MSETIDPLLFMREYIINGKAITIVDKHLDFGNGVLRLPLDTQTAWKRYDEKGLYTLGSLYLMVQNRTAKISEFAKESARLNIP